MDWHFSTHFSVLSSHSPPLYTSSCQSAHSHLSTTSIVLVLMLECGWFTTPHLQPEPDRGNIKKNKKLLISVFSPMSRVSSVQFFCTVCSNTWWMNEKKRENYLLLAKKKSSSIIINYCTHEIIRMIRVLCSFPTHKVKWKLCEKKALDACFEWELELSSRRGKFSAHSAARTEQWNQAKTWDVGQLLWRAR